MEEENKMQLLSENNQTESTELKKQSRYKCLKGQKKALLLVMTIVFVSTIALLLYMYYARTPSDESITYTEDIYTNPGVVRGLKEQITVRGQRLDICSFKGIPYAVPPVGELRFKNPVPLNNKNSWTGVYNASSFGNSCVQIESNITGSEDCLFLNVFTPNLNKQGNLSVFVWIHGGYLLEGNGNEVGYYPDPEFVSSMNIVGVSMNYRLNAFGFLTLKELWLKNISYGNYRIQDQILVLKWVQENIRQFGGNPSSITIAGESSGCSSVYAILASPSADGLFHRAICMSGAPLYKINYEKAARDNRIFIDKSRCSRVPDKDIKECLYNLSKEEIINAVPFHEYPNWAFNGTNDIPKKYEKYGAMLVLDPVLFKVSPNNMKDLVYPTKYKIPVLLGTLAQEIGYAPSKLFYNSTWNDFEAYAKPKLNEFLPRLYDKIVNRLYLNTTLQNKTKDESTQYFYETVASDVRVTCPNIKLAKDINLSQKHEVFHYVITNKPSYPILSGPYIRQYAFHAWDTRALFNFKKEKYSPSPSDILLKESLRDNIKHFMEHGSLINPNWTSGVTGVFNKEGNVVLTKEYHEKQCDFWNDPKNGFTDYAWNN